MAKKTVQGWAIAANGMLYSGWHYTRRSAIAEHIHDVRMFGDPELPRYVFGSGLNEAQRAAWERCQKRGDRAVKVTITFDPQ